MQDILSGSTVPSSSRQTAVPLANRAQWHRLHYDAHRLSADAKLADLD
jgi:hypothetical protein